MGLSNFLNNFIGGFTFGMFGGNPFSGGIFSNLFMCGGYFSTRVDFFTFANPFPSIWGGDRFSHILNHSMPTTFANSSLPTIDFSSINHSIWNYTKNQQSEYFNQMNDYQEQIEKTRKERSENNVQYTSNLHYYPQYTMPYQSYYPLNSSLYDGITIKHPEKKERSNTNPDNKSQTTTSVSTVKTNTDNKGKSKSDNSSAKTDNRSQNSKKQSTSDNTVREFASIYAAKNITDKRFQKFFEESILKSEGRVYGKDNKEMAKAGVQDSVYAAYRKAHKLPVRKVKYMTDEEMCEIYYGIYKECGADKIKDDRMALYVFDVGVNSKPKKAIEFYKKSGNNPKKYEQLRRNFYHHLAKIDPVKYGTYLDGWMTRLKNVREYADNNLSASS